MRTILTCIVAILFMFSPPFLFGESNHDLIRLCNDVGDYAECSSQSPLVVLPWTVSQRDTTRKERRPPPPPEKKTTTTRVPKPQDDRSEQQEEKKEDSFWAGCASAFCGGMLNSIISSIFSGGKNEEEKKEIEPGDHCRTGHSGHAHVSGLASLRVVHPAP